MNLPKFSIGTLMAIVGVVALNLASTQFWSHSSSPSLFTGRLFTSIALQGGLFYLIRSRRTSYLAFWAGFEIFALAAAITTIYIDFFNGGDLVVADFMDDYLFNAYGFLVNLCQFLPIPYLRSRGLAILAENDTFNANALYEFLYFFPQIIIAVMGGFCIGMLHRVRLRAKKLTPLASASD